MIARLLKRAWLRAKIEWARQDVTVIEAEALAAPRRLAYLRNHIVHLQSQLQEIGG